MFKSGLKLRVLGQIAFVFMLALAASPFLPPHNKACAQNLESNVCDPNIWETMVGRAWIEAQREVEISKSLITRPDSVLELSCFDAWANNSGTIVGGIFSANGATQNTTKLNIDLVATSAVKSYLSQAQYAVNGLGGGSLTGITYNTSVSQSFSACGVQQEVWTAFKCKNMVDLRSVVFDAMKDNDPRLYYVGATEHSCPDAAAANATNFLFDHKNVWEAVLQSLDTPTVAASTANYFDIVETFSAMTAPTGACSAPIPTGVQIVQTDGSTTPEMVCPNPGCSYDGSSCVR